MKQLRPLFLTMSAALICCSPVLAHACDQDKTSGKSASTASMTKPSRTMTAGSADCCAARNTTTAMTAGAGGACTAEQMASCAGKKGMKNASMAEGSCSAHSMTSATTISMDGKSCAAHKAKTTAMAAGAGHACGTSAGAMTAGGPACSGANMSARHAGCSFCDDLTACDQEMHSLGAVAQVVPLKNGVMFVYTGDATKVRAMQSAMARRKTQTAVFASTEGNKALCGECKALRGAAASGKLSREVVNIDSGCLTLMTSSDPAVVARIHELAGVPATRIKI